MIPVIWWDGARGNWDCGLLLRVFEKYPSVFEQYNDKVYPDVKRAIVIVVGRPKIGPLKSYLSKLKSGVVIMTGDEECSFNCDEAVPKHLEMWTQCYAPHRSHIKERLLLGTPNRPGYKYNTWMPKKYLWSFVGQKQNPHRDKCVEVLSKLRDGFLHVVDGFGGQGNGIEYQQYLDICCQSRFVICPSGSMTADTFRVYEAMECGAIPIADRRSPRDEPGFNYWIECYPHNTVFAISEWTEEIYEFMQCYPLHPLEEIDIPVVAAKMDYKNNFWWEKYKQGVENKLLELAV